MTGKLIVFEGTEGSGKSTQIDLTRNWLNKNYDFETVITCEPTYSQLGLKVRELLLNKKPEIPIDPAAETLLIAADRAQHVACSIKPWLDRGAVVLCDRFIDSTIAYQGYGRGLSQLDLERINNFEIDGLDPDLRIWLDLPVRLGLARAKTRGRLDTIESLDIEFHERVYDGYFNLWQENDDIKRVNANRPAQESASLSTDEVQAEIRELIKEIL